MPRLWMEPKRPKPSPRQVERVVAKLKAGARATEVAQCCAECHQALKWVKRGPLAKLAR
jgi:hypothetical protein